MKFSTAIVTVLFSIFLCSKQFASTNDIPGNMINSLRIVILGSSTAEGSGPLNPDNAWVNRYRTYLQSANQNSEVINLARGGYSTYRIMPDGFNPPPTRPAPDPERNITKALSLKPTAVIINLPSNDATLGYTVEEQLTNYDSILAVASDQNIPVWITTTQPRNLGENGRKNLMEMRDSTFARFGDKAIDFWYGLALYNGEIIQKYDSGDGVHLNDAAHKILFERVLISGIGLTKFSMRLLKPQDGSRLLGNTQIVWSPEIKSDSTYVTTIDISRDRGRIWEQILSTTTSDTSYSWDTSHHPDGTRYKVRVAMLGVADIGIAVNQETFTINNPGNAIPEAEILAPVPGETLAGEVEIRWHAADADEDRLTILLELSNDGAIWQIVADDEANDGHLLWNTKLLANSPFYHLKLKCTDGAEWVEVISSPFTIENKTEIILSANLNHISGSGDGLISARIVDPDLITDHSYRITFNDTTPEVITYDVIDLDTELTVVENATELDGKTEGPLFDGIRLLISNYEETVVDLDSSGWKTGISSLGSEISNGTGIFKGIPYPADYKIIIFDDVVDTSSAFIGTAVIPMKFSVTNITENHLVDVVFVEQDNDQNISRGDQVFILENNEHDKPFLTWLILFTGNDSSVAALPGDVYLLKTLKPFSSKDVFEFTASTTDISQSDLNQIPSEFQLFQNYPNPFNPMTAIEYNLPKNGEVTIELYNLLGERLDILVNEIQPAGKYKINVNLHYLASGVYFYKFTSGSFEKTKKMIFLK